MNPGNSPKRSKCEERTNGVEMDRKWLGKGTDKSRCNLHLLLKYVTLIYINCLLAGRWWAWVAFLSGRCCIITLPEQLYSRCYLHDRCTLQLLHSDREVTHIYITGVWEGDDNDHLLLTGRWYTMMDVGCILKRQVMHNVGLNPYVCGWRSHSRLTDVAFTPQRIPPGVCYW